MVCFSEVPNLMHQKLLFLYNNFISGPKPAAHEERKSIFIRFPFFPCQLHWIQFKIIIFTSPHGCLLARPMKYQFVTNQRPENAGILYGSPSLGLVEYRDIYCAIWSFPPPPFLRFIFPLTIKFAAGGTKFIAPKDAFLRPFPPFFFPHFFS